MSRQPIAPEALRAKLEVTLIRAHARALQELEMWIAENTMNTHLYDPPETQRLVWGYELVTAEYTSGHRTRGEWAQGIQELLAEPAPSPQGDTTK